MWSEFEKNVFLPNETVRGFVHVDNQHCTIDCNRVEFAVQQKLKLTIRGHAVFGEGQPHTWCHEPHLIEQNLRGPNAGVGDWKQEMTLDLSKIHYEVQTDKKNKKSGGRK